MPHHAHVAAVIKRTREVLPLRAASSFHLFESACLGDGPKKVIQKPKIQLWVSVRAENRLLASLYRREARAEARFELRAGLVTLQPHGIMIVVLAIAVVPS